MSAVEPPELVLCVPGPWPSREDFLKAVAKESGGYLFAGRILMHMEDKSAFEVQFEGASPQVTKAFGYAGRHWAQGAEMAEIARHASVVYLIGKGGSRESAESLMRAGAGLVRAGGLGVKVESTGIAHSPPTWLKLTQDQVLYSAHKALVVYVTGPDIYSCGMHSFGLRDAIVREADRDAAVELLRVFTWYMFSESPAIKAGQTFSTEKDAPSYRIEDDPGVTHEDESLFHNPYGTWRLVPLDSPGLRYRIHFKEVA